MARDLPPEPSVAGNRDVKPPIDPPSLHSEPRAFIKVTNVAFSDLLLVVFIFNEVARYSNLKYAIVGGLSAHIFGGWRQTKTLDILLGPRLIDDH